MTDEPPALFDVPELAIDRVRTGRAEAALHAALAAAVAAGTVIPEDAGMVAGALIGARVLDGVDRIADPKARAYAAAAVMTPWREYLHALRLPAEVTASDPRGPAQSAGDAPSWLGDAFGTASD